MAVVELNKTLIIVIAVSVLICCIITLFLIFKFYHPPTTAPLPPIQPLAHHREMATQRFPYPYIHRKSMGLEQVGRYGSNTPSPRPSRMPSFQIDESPDIPFSSYHSFSIPPSPPTGVAYGSGPFSVGSHSDEHVSFTYPPHPSRSRSRWQPSCKNSTASIRSATTCFSTRSANTIHGAPHSPNSDIQIVLPTPLAPQLQNHMVANLQQLQLSVFSCESCGELTERGCAVDRWMSAPSRTTSHRPNHDRVLLTGGDKLWAPGSPFLGYNGSAEAIRIPDAVRGVDHFPHPHPTLTSQSGKGYAFQSNTTPLSCLPESSRASSITAL